MILAITQARISSSRFPEKVLQEVDGFKLLELHLKRIKRSKLINELVVAVADEPGAEKIEKVAKECGVNSFRGSVTDVLARFHGAGKKYSPNIVVRLTSDCPLIDANIIDEVIKLQSETNADYVSNVHPPTFPDGMDVEVVKWSALDEANSKAVSTRDREHVMPYIWSQPEKFNLKNFTGPEDYSSLRLTVDYPEDLEVIKGLVKKLGPFNSYKTYIEHLQNDPALQNLNKMRMRNEAFRKNQ